MDMRGLPRGVDQLFGLDNGGRSVFTGRPRALEQVPGSKKRSGCGWA